MKRQLILLGMLICVSSLFSQGIKFGVFVDPQISWFLPDSRIVNSEGIRWGVNGGLSLDNYFQKNYAFSSGISLGTQGGKLKYDNATTVSTTDGVDSLPAGTIVKYKLQYITVPLGLKLKSNEIGYFSFFANVGFTPQINIKATGESDNTGGLENNTLEDEIGLFNLGYHFGGGVEYALGEDTSLNVGLVYHNGFLDIFKSNVKVQSRVISLRLGITF